jgi:hypothetical protein
MKTLTASLLLVLASVRSGWAGDTYASNVRLGWPLQFVR